LLPDGRPAYAQASTVHWLRWADFIPASDQLLKTKIAPECEKVLGLKLTLEMINANDLQARITSGIQSGAGPDIIYAIGNWQQLYGRKWCRCQRRAEEIGEAQGGYYEVSRRVATVGKKWIGVPWSAGGGRIAYRKSWFQEVGYDTFPETWDTLRDGRQKAQGQGTPVGGRRSATLSATRQDFGTPYLCRGVQGSRGGRQDRRAEQQGLRSSRSNMRWALEDACDEGGLAWSEFEQQPRPFSRAPSAPPITAPRSISRPRKSPTGYLTAKGTPMKDDILTCTASERTGGQFNFRGRRRTC